MLHMVNISSYCFLDSDICKSTSTEDTKLRVGVSKFLAKKGWIIMESIPAVLLTVMLVLGHNRDFVVLFSGLFGQPIM